MSVALHEMAVVLAALAACSSPAAAPSDGGARQPRCANRLMSSAPPAAVVHVGPDVTVQVSCAGTVVVPVVSASALGEDGFWWRASIEGDRDTFSIPTNDFLTCPGDGVTVANVIVTPPPVAKPGDTFDATLTVSPRDDEFAPSTARVHAQVVAPTFTIVPDTVDLGDVPYGEERRVPVVFRNPSATRLLAEAVLQVAPFRLGKTQVTLEPFGGTSSVAVGIDVADVGEHVAELAWRAAPTQAGVPEACTAHGTAKARARVVPQADGGDR